MSAASLGPYLARPMTPPEPDVLEAIDAGPIDPAAALGLDSLDRLLDPAPLACETGWCTLPDGVGYAAVRTVMPRVSAAMIDWWFDWHQRESIRYQIWYPGAHTSIKYSPAGIPGDKPYWGSVHHPVEDVGIGEAALAIAFRPPRDLGFSSDALDDPRVGTIVCGFVGFDRARLRHTVMAHVFLAAPAGLVLRSRFWLGAILGPNGDGATARAVTRVMNRPSLRRLVVSKQAPEAMARHCAAEYANLATLLPEIHSGHRD